MVVGHLLETNGGWGWDDPPQRALLTVIYAVHMPAFVFLTGIHARADRVGLRIARLVAVLLVFQVAFLAFRWMLGAPEADWYWPYWVLWYVMAMIWWQALMPLIARFPLAALGAALGLAVAVGVVDLHGNWFAYSRAAVLLPFFVAGHLWGNRALRVLPVVTARSKATVAAVFLGGVVVLFVLGGDPHWLFGNWGYAQLGVPATQGVLGRISVLLVAVAGVASLIALAPARMPALERAGRHSLAVFLFSVFAVEVYAVTLGMWSAGWPAAVAATVALATGIAITALFSAERFERLCRSVYDIPQAIAARPSRSSGGGSNDKVFPSAVLVPHNGDSRRPSASSTDPP